MSENRNRNKNDEQNISKKKSSRQISNSSLQKNDDFISNKKKKNLERENENIDYAQDDDDYNYDYDEDFGLDIETDSNAKMKKIQMNTDQNEENIISENYKPELKKSNRKTKDSFNVEFLSNDQEVINSDQPTKLKSSLKKTILSQMRANSIKKKISSVASNINRSNLTTLAEFKKQQLLHQHSIRFRSDSNEKDMEDQVPDQVYPTI